MDGLHSFENDKSSFWKKNSKAVPGRPSPKKEVQRISRTKTVGPASYHEFQASISDAWAVEDDDFCLTSGTKISKKVSQSAALNVLNVHRTFEAPVHHCENVNLSVQEKNVTHVKNKFPGRPRPLPSSTNTLDKNTESKLERFETLLANTPTIDELAQLSWSGVPQKVRPIIWRLLAGYLPINQERRQTILERKRQDYWNLVQQYYDTERDEASQDTYHQIHIDVPRMNPSVALFQQETVQKMFERILFIWAIRHPASGYVQGINDLVTPFFVVFLQEFIPNNEPFETFSLNTLHQDKLDIIEADSFWCLSKFLDAIQDNYVFAQLGIQQKVNQLKELIQRVDNNLHCHLMQHNIDYLQFSFRWLNNLLTRELPLRCTIRLWDTYLAEGDSFASFQLYVCAAFLLYWRDMLLLETDFQGLMLLLQNLPTQDWRSSNIDMVVAEAYRLKVMFADAPNHLQNNRNPR
ncbi:TBC1 domain family member 22B isoform X2 [Agrilus planipennis]|uniref:TBC1 domain family member 22B isoform X2 n=1 Tax=Agrilus planipennis TaxID=224129 RepID=A0A1W4WP62_AGRPL|nr:TBC1 domain family member 22B isoform X2 [Agrilus planipennis]